MLGPWQLTSLGRNPQRNMPIGMLASLKVCTVIYIGVAVVLTGRLKWDQHGTAEPLATAFSALGMNWTAAIMSLGAVFATTSVLVVFQLGQPRLFFSMARDGLLPQLAGRVHPRYRTPHITTIRTGAVVGLAAGCANINDVVELTNIGTLFAFVLVAAGILMLQLPATTWIRFVVWLVAGAIVYFVYGIRHSRLRDAA